MTGVTAAVLDRDTVAVDVVYARANATGENRLVINASSLPSGEEPSGTFSDTCHRDYDGFPFPGYGCYPFTGAVDCVNVVGSVAVISGPIQQTWDPTAQYRATVVVWDNAGPGGADVAEVTGYGSSAGGPGSPDCTMYQYQPSTAPISGTVTLHDAPGTTTFAGSGVTVSPPDQNGERNVGFTFANVTEPGVTTVSTSGTGPEPSGFVLTTNPPLYYDLHTTAVFTGDVEVCINFNASGLTDEQAYQQRLYHYADGVWQDITTFQDYGRVCGVTTSFSPFAIGEPAAVAWPFRGYLSPVDSMPTANVMKAGAAVPLKFGLGTYRGLDIFGQSPASGAVSCATAANADSVEQTAAAGSSSLSYDTASDTYTYVWKTQKGWAGTCRRFVLTLADGTTHEALFKFTK